MSNDIRPDAPEVALKVALATLEGKYETRGHKVDVIVSPCSWIYKGYGFQIEFRMESGASWGTVNDTNLTCATATRADVQRAIDSLLARECTRCKCPYVAEPKSNRGALCETCWMDDWKKGVAKLEADDRKAVARQDARMVKKGFTHRVTAWVHAGGDDKCIDLYTTGEPTKEEIVKHLRKARSRVLDDYKVFKLTVTND